MHHKLFTKIISEYPWILCTLGQRKKENFTIYGLSPDVIYGLSPDVRVSMDTLTEVIGELSHLLIIPRCQEYPWILLQRG